MRSSSSCSVNWLWARGCRPEAARPAARGARARQLRPADPAAEPRRLHGAPRERAGKREPGRAVVDRPRRLQGRSTSMFGHAGGDAALREIADRLLRLAGPRDVVCRYGGDEFWLLAGGIDGLRGPLPALRPHPRGNCRPARNRAAGGRRCAPRSAWPIFPDDARVERRADLQDGRRALGREAVRGVAARGSRPARAGAGRTQGDAEHAAGGAVPAGS